MARHKRKKQLSDHERAAAVEAATRLHRYLSIDLLVLFPGTPDYQALMGLSQCCVATIRQLTGEDPEWMRPAVSSGRPAADWG